MSKEHAYAYEAGYRDGSVHYELEHCPACKNIADLQESLEENTKLIVKLNAEHIVRQNVEAENAKLRELVRNALTALGNNCAKCAYRDGCTILQDCKCRAPERLLEDMRELGIEVDE